MSSEAPALPGFELEMIRQADDAGVVDVSSQEYTSERLQLMHPDKYAIAVRAFFELQMSKRSICDLVKISYRTLEAIIQRETSGARVFCIKRRVANQRALTQLRATERLQDLLEDDDAVTSAGIVGLTKAIQALGDVAPDQAPTTGNTSPASYADYADIVDVYPADGLDEGKTRAAAAPGAIDDGTGCSDLETGTDGDCCHIHSLQQSGSDADIKGFRDGVDTLQAESGIEGPSDAMPAESIPGAASPMSIPPGAGGAPGGARAPL